MAKDQANIEHYARYWVKRLFVPDVHSEKIDHRECYLPPCNAFQWTFYDIDIETGETINMDHNYYCYGNIYTKKEIDNLHDKGISFATKMLVENMTLNEWDKVIWLVDGQVIPYAHSYIVKEIYRKIEVNKC